MKPDSEKRTHFGFEEVSEQEKTQKVKAVFASVASKYDVMNDLMSFGLHHLWKRATVEMASIRPHYQVLDLAGGTGDLAASMAKRLGSKGNLVLSDINQAMLSRGRDRLIDQAFAKQLQYVQADAETLAFADDSFDVITIAFGLRNVTVKENALAEMYRCLKPGGKCLILEFSKPTQDWFAKAYDAYSFNIIPKIGKWVANDEKSYQYLVESIRKHPDQQSLKQMMLAAGFDDCDYVNLTGGVVAIHKGYKY